MSNPCPYGHQMCSEKEQCTITPVQIDTWWEEAKRIHPMLPGKPEPSLYSARYERVMDRVKRCKHARPFMTSTPAQQDSML